MNARAINEAAVAHGKKQSPFEYEHEAGFEAGAVWVIRNMDDYLETYFEIVGGIFYAMNSQEPSVVRLRYEEQGRCGMYELAKEWADEFHSLHADTEWDGEWLEVLDEFVKSKNELT